MATDKTSGFDTLFNKCVPHILEKIFFSLDYDSFQACRKVSSEWNDLLSSDVYQREAAEMLYEKRRNEGHLLKSSRDGDVDKVRSLLSNGVDKNCERYTGRTPIYQAFKFKHRDVVKILLEAGAELNGALEDGLALLNWSSVSGLSLIHI